MASPDVISTRLEITGEAAYRQKLKQISLAMKQVNSEGKVTDATFGKADRSVAKLTQVYGQLDKKLSLQKTRLKAIGEEYERVAGLEGENSESARRLAAEYNSTSARVADLEKEMKDLNDEMQKSSSGWDKAIKAAERIQDKYSKVGNTMQKVGKKIASVTLAASSAVIGASAKSYIELADSMAILYTIADETAVPMEEMMQATLDASSDLGIAATELANAQYQAISAGVDTAKSVDFVGVAAKGAKAGLSDVTTVVDASTSIINAWGYAWEDATSIMDKMLVAQQFGKTTVGEISQSIGNLTGLAPQLGMSFEEIMAATAALTKNGVATAQSMTGLRGVMSAVLKPTAEASKLAATLGLDFNAAAMQSKGFAGFLEDVLEKTDGNSEHLAVLFGQVEGLSAVMSLAGSAAGDFSTALEMMGNSAGTLDTQFATRMDSPAMRLEKALNRIKNAGISFGQTLAPYIEIAANALDKLGETLNNLSSEEQMALVKTAAWVAGIGSAIAVAGKLVTSLKGLATAGKFIFSGPAGWVVGGAIAVAGLVAAMSQLITVTRDFNDAWADVQDGYDSAMAQNVAMTIGAEIDTEPAMESIATAMEALGEAIITKLTDGLPDDEATVSALKADVSERFTTLLAAVEQQLSDDLSGVNPDSADYEAQCAAIIAEAEATKAELAAMESEYYTFIDTYSGKSAATVKAHVDDLETLEEKVLKITENLEAAYALQQSAAAHSYKVVAAGATTNTTTIAEAWQYAYQDYKLKEKQIIDEFDADIASLNAEFAEGLKSEAEFAEEQATLEAAKSSKIAVNERVWKENATELLEGMRAGFEAADPESVGAADALLALIKKSAAIDEEIPESSWEQMAKDILPEKLWSILPKSAEAQMQEALSKSLAAKTDKMADNPYVEMLNAIFGSEVGGALGVDTADMQSVLSTAAGDLSGATIDGYTAGIEDGTESVDTAMAEMMESGVDAAKDAIDSHSPSRVYRDLGHDAIDGMVLGMQDRRGRLISAMREIARAAVNAARDELDIHSPSRVMFEMGEQTAQGYINAINSKVADVQTSMRRFAYPKSAFTGSGAAQTSAVGAVTGNGSTTINVQYSAPYGRKEALRFGGVLAQGMTDAKKAYGG